MENEFGINHLYTSRMDDVMWFYQMYKRVRFHAKKRLQTFIIVPSLYDEEKYYKTHKHLEGIPSEEEVLKEGMDVDRFVSLLLQKLEISIIQNVEQQKELDKLKEQVSALQKQIEKLNKY